MVGAGDEGGRIYVGAGVMKVCTAAGAGVAGVVGTGAAELELTCALQAPPSLCAAAASMPPENPDGWFPCCEACEPDAEEEGPAWRFWALAGCVELLLASVLLVSVSSLERELGGEASSSLPLVSLSFGSLSFRS